MTEKKEITKSRGQVWLDEQVMTDDRRDRMAAAAKGSGIDPQKLEAILCRAVIDNPDLMKCQPSTLFSAMMSAAELGLSPSGHNNGAYFAVYKGECKLGLGFGAMIDLATRSGKVRSFKTEAVWPTDEFEVHAGTENRIFHRPDYEKRAGNPKLFYAVAFFADGGCEFEVMTEAQVCKIRDNSRNADGAPWKFQFGEMAKKTVLRRLIKRMPLTPQAAEMIEDADLVDGYERNGVKRRVTNTAEELVREILPDSGRPGGEEQGRSDEEDHGPPSSRPKPPTQHRASEGLREPEPITADDIHF